MTQPPQPSPHPSCLAWSCLAIAVLAMGLVAFRDRWAVVRHNHDVGHADEAAYALQARSLLTRGSLRISFVSTFFHRYSPDIDRYDDHWPPFLALLLAPAFAWGGCEPVVGRTLCLAIGALALPLAAAFLGAAATRRVWGGLLAALLVLGNPLVLRESARILSDVPQTTLLALYCAGVLAARRQPRWLLVAGVAGALACLAKGSELILLPMLPALAALSGGWRLVRSRELVAAALLFAAVLAPWWTTMAVEYGHPFHSTQNYVASFYGVEPDWDQQVHWDEGFYRVYWGRDLPRPTDRFRDLEAWGTGTARNAGAIRAALLEGPTLHARVHRMALAGCLMGALLWLSLLRIHGNDRVRELAASALLLLGVGACHAAFLIALWSARERRFVLPFVPLLAAGAGVALALAGELLRAIARMPQRVHARGSLLLCAVALAAFGWRHEQLFAWQLDQSDIALLRTDYYPRYHQLAQSMKAAGVPPDAVVMMRKPWEFLFYAPRETRGLGLPYAEPPVILGIARYYRATHFVFDCERPGLAAYLRSRPPGLVPVCAEPFPVYAIDWSRFREDELRPFR